MFSFRTIVLGCAALALAGCLEAETPLLSEATPLLGSRVELHLYPVSDPDATLRFSERSKDARKFVPLTLAWDGKRYVADTHSRRRMTEPHNYVAFTVHELENGDHIVQAFRKNPAARVTYWPLRKLHEGVYFGTFINTADAEFSELAQTCGMKYACTMETREQLLAWARAAAARKSLGTGFLVIRTSPIEQPAEKGS